MRRFLNMMLCVAVAVSACVQIDGPGTAVPGEGDVHAAVLPESVYASGEGIIYWNGFKDYARLYLGALSDGQRYDVRVDYVTASGLVFTVPAGVPAGDYSLMLEQDGMRELGHVRILDALMPVTSLSMPSTSLIGEDFIVRGVGFKEDSRLWLADQSGEVFTLETFLSPYGMNVTPSSGIPAGTYSLWLSQDGGSWLLSASFTLVAKGGKKLVALRQTAPYSGSVKVLYTWELVQEGDALSAVRLSQDYLDGDTVEEDARDVYTCLSQLSFDMTQDGLESSNDVRFDYLLDEDGNVSASEVTFYGKDAPTHIDWVYDPEGFLARMSYFNAKGQQRDYCTIAYEDGNITSFGAISFAYDDDTLVNHPEAYDVAWAYMMMRDKISPSKYFPYLMGIYTPDSRLLPTSVSFSDGYDLVTSALEYTFDADGYVCAMSWREGMSSCSIDFIYAE